MSFTFAICGVVALYAAALIPSGKSAICGVLLVVASNAVCLLEKILEELRAKKQPRGHQHRRAELTC